MKKIFAILLLFTILFTGCGTTVDYTDPTAYKELLTSRIDMLDSELLPTLEELVDVTGTQESYDNLVKSMGDTLNIYLTTFSDNPEQVYNNFKENLDTFTFPIDTPSEQLKKVIEKYNSADEATQKLITQSVNKIFDFYTNIITKIDEGINGMPAGQLEVMKDFKDMIGNYIESNGLNLKDEVTSILGGK